MFEENLKQNDLTKNDTLAGAESSLIETKSDRAATEEELKDLEIFFSFEKIEAIKKLLIDIQNNITRVICLLSGSENVTEFPKEDLAKLISDFSLNPIKFDGNNSVALGEQKGGRVVEGVFNGQNMIGADGKEYSVPANYASKSKLVEGDILKLIINQRGEFIYKQIGPIERTRIVGTLTQDKDSENFIVLSQGKRWRVLTASVTYFKGAPGDEVVILVPKNTPSRWAAVENIIKKSEE